jgi:hypothetical protein
MNGDWVRWILVILGVVGPLVGALHLYGRQRDDKQDLRADKQDEKIAEGQRALASHIEANVRTHAEHGERLAKLEAHTSTHDAEIRKLRDMRHDINHETAKLILEYYNSTMERINELKDRILGRGK